jgi:heme/copper-type cytochrome/quinol oxidase subunit 4
VSASPRTQRDAPSAPTPGHGTGRTPHAGAGPRTYLVVAAFLVAITIMEVWVFYIPGLARVLVPILILLSSAKFALVAMFYMHLRFDHAWFSYLFVGPLIIALGLAVALLWLFHHFGTTGAVGAGGPAGG